MGSISNNANAKEAPATTLRYGLNDSLTGKETLLYGLQHFAFFLANSVTFPILVGSYLGLDAHGLATLIQRTFIVCGIGSFIQAFWGHKMPIFEGPSGMWVGVYIVLSIASVSFGKPIGVLRTDLEMGLLVGGVICILMGVTGLMGRIAFIFSPIVNGVFLLLMALQLSQATLKGMLGITNYSQVINMKCLIVSIITISLTLWVSVKLKGFFQSLSIMVGTAVGWVIAIFLNLSPRMDFGMQLPIIPKAFVWGTPTFDPGIMLTCILTTIVLYANFFVAIVGMGNLINEPYNKKVFGRSAIISGIDYFLASVCSGIGVIPYAASIGFINLTGVATRRPFLVGALILILLGICPPIGIFFAAIPPTVSSSVLFVAFMMVIGVSLKEFLKTNLAGKQAMIISLSVFAGIGVMFLPQGVFNQVPSSLRYLLSNGLFDGVILAILLENVLLREKKTPQSS